MQSSLKFILFLVLNILCSSNLTAQKIEGLQQELATVETGKSTFRQTLLEVEDGMVQYTVVEEDGKGREEETLYTFSFADIDDNTVRALTKKDVIVVQLLVNGKQKLVKETMQGGDKVSYTDELQLLATDSDNGNVLVELIKKTIPEVVELEEKRLALDGYDAHMDWLVQNVGDVELPKKQIVQKLSSNQIPGNLIFTQTTSAKNKSETHIWELNLATLNPNSIGYRIAGDEFIISVSTRRGIKGIKHIEDGEQKNFQDDIQFFAKSISNGKNLYKVLQELVKLSEETFTAYRPTFQNQESAIQFLNAAIDNIGTTEETVEQIIQQEGNMSTLTQTEVSPDKSDTYQYSFNFGDINANNIDYDGQKDRLYVVLPTKKSVDFIRVTENGELQNYTNEVKVYFNSIEDAIIGAEALKTLVIFQEEKMEATPRTTTSIANMVEELKHVMQKVTIGEDTYDLFIELTDPSNNTLKITTVFSNLKKSEELVHEFNLMDINPKNCSIEIRGKHVMAELNTNHLEKIVKTYIDGEIKPYQYKITIEANGVEEARQIVQLFTQQVTNL